MILYKVYRVCVLLSIYNLLSNVKSSSSIHQEWKFRFYGTSYFIVNWDAIHLNPMWAISQGPVAHLSANHITSQIASSWKSEAWWSYLQSGKSIGLAGRFAFLCWPKENLKKGGQPQLARILTSRNIYRGDCRFAASFSFLFLRVLHSVAGKRIAFFGWRDTS